jgi:hypothetical protein
MTTSHGTNSGCLVVGEYVDEGEVPEEFAPLKNHPARSEVDRPRLVADYVDLWSNGETEKEFTVLLHDNRTVTVRGHSVQLVEASCSDAVSYAVVRHANGTEVMVALFKANQVTGIFSGTMQLTQ